MSDDLSCIRHISPDKDIAQWVTADYVHSEYDKKTGDTTHHVSLKPLMPCTTIFVHGVNSEGEWYAEAMTQFCAGLNNRLGRTDLKAADYIEETRRFNFFGNGKLARCPIIPFYWGYKLQPGDLERYPGIYHDDFDMAWGGGPFQNGTNNLYTMWRGGFQRIALHFIDLQYFNPEIDRFLSDAPPRWYQIHAARRLAYLVETIRRDFPNEPLNIVAHSQGNMITLLAMLFLEQATRSPDTLILNSAPYAFDNKFADWMTAAHGINDTQTSEARVNTFKAVTDRIAAATKGYPSDETVSARCRLPAIQGIDTVRAHYHPNDPEWPRFIGNEPVNEAGQRWDEDPFSSRDNRGRVFVNFNPNDRVIGVMAIAGIGWRGIPEQYLSGPPDKDHPAGKPHASFRNVYQRIFVRNADRKAVVANGAGGKSDNGFDGEVTHTFPPGAKEGYWFQYFHTRMAVRSNVTSGYGLTWTTEAGPLQSENDYVVTHDGKHLSEFWSPPPKNAALFFPAQNTPSWDEKVWINAPKVPLPAVLGDDYNSPEISFDGSAGVSGIVNEAQQQDFADFKRFNPLQRIRARDADGHPTTRLETTAERDARVDKLGKIKIPQTDHARFLQYKTASQPVAQVLSYDLTVGAGYAWADPQYWGFLLNLADWKQSDDCYLMGKPYPQDVLPPPGLDITT